MQIPTRPYSRRFTRTPLAAAATRLLVAGSVTDAVTLDISEAGMAILTTAPLDAGVECMVAVDLPGDGKPAHVNAWARVVYSLPVMRGYRIGLRFCDMDANSLDCIRRVSCEP